MDQDQPSQQPYHLTILELLQAKARHAQSRPPSSPATPYANHEEGDNPEGKSGGNEQWTLADDALLVTFLHEFSRHVQRRTAEVSGAIRSLQDATNTVGVDVATVQGEWMLRSGDLLMEHGVRDEDEDDGEYDTEEGEDDDDDEDEEITALSLKGAAAKKAVDDDEGKGDESDDDNSSADIARLEEEEKSAIENGMKALKLFYDPTKHSAAASVSSGLGSTFLTARDMEDDVIGENCYYYLSAKADGFNRRPLPFIVGSREFMESSHAGLGPQEAEGGSEEEQGGTLG